MARFRVRLSEVDAVQFTGDNVTEVRAFTGYEGDEIDEIEADATLLILETDAGDLTAEAGDWIVKREDDLYCYSDDLFCDVYVPAEQ